MVEARSDRSPATRLYNRLSSSESREESAVDAVDPRSQAIIDGLESIDPEYVLHLPSSTLKHIINYCLERPTTKTFPLPLEQEGVGILAGLVLAGKRAVMIIQDNGIGNLLTTLTTFPQAYHIPQLM